VTTSQRRRPSTHSPWEWTRLFLLLRALLVVLGLQISGAAHAVVDAVAVLTDHAVEHDEPCPPSGPCDECPVGCPDCHCPNAFRSGLPQSVATLLEPSHSEPLLAWFEQRAPVSPDPSLPFRPPRTLLAS
jgi:hypothetical protein